MLKFNSWTGLIGAGLFLGLAAGARLHAGGVTLITHGFNGNVTDWVSPMAEEMMTYPGFPGSEATIYVLEVTNTWGVATAVWQQGVQPNLSDSGEIFILLDWSAIAGLFQASSGEVAAIAVDALLDPGLIAADTGSRPLAELPLHLIGHSRGASVVTEMAKLLGSRGIWVNQVTSLDPVPLALNGDAEVRNWENILFTDNYWEEIDSSAFLHGDPLTGAYNRELTTLNGGNGSAHSDVHLWYHGTVELDTPATSAEADITSAMRESWWTTEENEGGDAGFRFSRLGGGDWLSELRPAGTGTDRIRDGLNGMWDFGAGTVSNRTALPANNGEWPNVILCRRTDTIEVVSGSSFDLEIDYQGGPDISGQLSLTIILDPDRNPWNGNEYTVDAGAWPTTGTDSVNLAEVSVPTTGMPAGTYAVAAELNDGSRTRSLYAAEALEILIFPPPEIDRSTVRMSLGQMTFSIIGSAGQLVEISASVNLVDWSPIHTEELDAGSWEFNDGDSHLFPRRFYRVREAP